MKKVISEVFFL